MSAQQCLLATIDIAQTPELNQVFPFTIVPVTYTLAGLSTIRGLVQRGIIYAMHDPRNSGDFATYSSMTRSPTLRVGFNDFGSGPDARESRKGLLLHECIHAMQDNLAATRMRVDTAEAAAYTAQCLFHRACGRTQGELSHFVAAAWDATDLILQPSSNRSVAESDIQGLLNTIRIHPTYVNEFDVTGRYDGIHRPAPPPQRSSGCNASSIRSRSGLGQLVRQVLGL